MTVSEYLNLKQQICYDVEKNENKGHLIKAAKELFKHDINSARRYEKIKNIKDLFYILELRDLLSEDDVTPLKKLTQLYCSNQQVLNALTNYEVNHVPSQHKNYFVEEKRPKFNGNSYRPLCIEELSDEKMKRIKDTVTEGIGTFWRDLGRNLKLRECDIDEIDMNNDTLHKKACQIMNIYYERKADPDRWFFVLCSALEKSRRKDISKELQAIVTMNI